LPEIHARYWHDHANIWQGTSNVAEKAGMPRESLYRALGPRGNPIIKILLAVLNASGLHAKMHYGYFKLQTTQKIKGRI
jgi:DNA-binding phage protein